MLQDHRIDLIQVHNLLDWKVQVSTLRDLKSAGRIRYIGITHYSASAFAEVESVLRSETLDFLQINYAMFVLSHPAVTCTIPGTGRPEHMLDNIGAGFGRMPDVTLRARMIDYCKTN